MADISRITLPSGTTYDLKDTVARQMISTGISFIIAWDGTDTPVANNIPAGVVAGSVVGTLSTADAVPGAFYLVKSSTTPSSEILDIYEEYVVIKPVTSDNTTWFWEKIGDTKLNLTDVVTNVTLNKQTESVIGANATLSTTQPTISLSSSATGGEGIVSVVTGITNAEVSGDDITVITGLGTPSTATVIGENATIRNTQPTIALSSSNESGTGRVQLVGGITPSSTNIGATASGANVDWNSNDATTVITGYTPSSDTFVKTISTTSKKLATTSITGVSGSTVASKATASTNQTTATGGGTSSSENTDWLKGVSVSGETLTIGAATMNTQTTTQYTFSDVTVPTADSATVVATGKVATTDTNGDTIVTAAQEGTTASAVTGLGTPSTASVIGDNATFTVTQPTITLANNATGSGVVAVINNVTPTSVYISATASGGKAEWDNKDSKAVVTGYANPTTDDALGASSTVAITPTSTNLQATASGANTTWGSKDEVSVLTNSTAINVTKGNS